MTAIPVENIVDEPENPLVRAPLVEGDNDFASVTNIIAAPAEGKTPRGWYLMFGVAIALLANLGAMIGYLVFTGIATYLPRRLGETDHAGCANGIRRQHTARAVPGNIPTLIQRSGAFHG